MILVTAPQNLFAVLAETAPATGVAATAVPDAVGMVISSDDQKGRSGDDQRSRPMHGAQGRLALSWQLGDEGTITHPAVSTVPAFRLGPVDTDPMASIANIAGMLPASLTRRPEDLDAYVKVRVSGPDLEIQIDVDGSIQGFQPQQIIVLSGCAAAFSPQMESEFILKTLINYGNLVIAPQR